MLQDDTLGKSLAIKEVVLLTDMLGFQGGQTDWFWCVLREKEVQEEEERKPLLYLGE